MSKLSQLQIKKLREIEYNQYLQTKLAETKQTRKSKKEKLIANIRDNKVRYFDFEHDSGGEQLCLLLQNQNHLTDKQREALQKLAYTLLQKGWDSWLNDSRVVNALACVAKYENLHAQSLAHYRPISHNPYREFAHLLRFLFAQYPVPAFLDTAFYYQNDTHIRWYLHLARGGSVRTLDNMPLNLTQKMRHYFLQAPAEATIPQALRYAQVLGLGSSRRLARCVMETRLGGTFENEAFWETVIRFLVQNPMLDTRYIQSVVDFAQWIKFENREVREGGRVQHLPPVEPNFSMKGRSVPALLRLVEVWEEEQKSLQKTKPESTNWVGVPVSDFEWAVGEEAKTMIYRVKQIRTIYALREEGSVMNHCVATYYASCVEGRSSIWSMTCEDAYGNTKRLLTVELNARCVIQQARSYCNQMPSQMEYEVMRQWSMARSIGFSYDMRECGLRD